MANRRRPRSLRGMEQAVDGYLADCERQERLPTVTGLALALGFSSRGEMERFGTQEEERFRPLLDWACSRIEEETLQAACRKETAAGARFILQSQLWLWGKVPQRAGPHHRPGGRGGGLACGLPFPKAPLTRCLFPI